MRRFLLIHAQTYDHDGLATELFDRICSRLRDVAGSTAGDVGYHRRLDRPAPPGELEREIASSTVVVVLCSDRTLASPVCGKVWSVFDARAANGRPTPIVPVLWMPLSPKSPRVPVRPINDEPLYPVLLGHDEPDNARYCERVLDELCERILRLGDSRTEPAVPVDLRRCANAFARPPTPIGIHVLAPTLDHAVDGRGLTQYGETCLDWNPFRREAPGPLQPRIIEFAQGLRYKPALHSLASTCEVLLSDVPADEPAVLLLDPWALDDPIWRKRLGDFDALNKRSVGVVAAWDLDDPETSFARRRLLAQLDTTLVHRWHRRRPALQMAAGVASSLDHLGKALAAVMHEATIQFLRHQD